LEVAAVELVVLVVLRLELLVVEEVRVDYLQ
jgi:hypothetical protein